MINVKEQISKCFKYPLFLEKQPKRSYHSSVPWLPTVSMALMPLFLQLLGLMWRLLGAMTFLEGKMTRANCLERPRILVASQPKLRDTWHVTEMLRGSGDDWASLPSAVFCLMIVCSLLLPLELSLLPKPRAENSHNISNSTA